MYIRTDYEISLCPAIRLAGGRSAENGPNLRQIQVATTSHRLYVIYSEVITTMSRLLSETLVSWVNTRECPVTSFGEVIDGRKLALHVEEKTKNADQEYGCLENLQNLLREGICAVEWLNQLHLFLGDNGFGDVIRTCSIVLNQAGFLNKLSKLHRDQGIAEELKVIAELLDWNIRQELRDTRLTSLADEVGAGERDSAYVVGELIKKLQERAEKNPDDNFAKASVRLFAWIVGQEDWDHLRSFPVFAQGSVTDNRTVIKLERNAYEEERPLAPVPSWSENLRPFSELFPWRYILADAFFEAVSDSNIWQTLDEQEFLKNDVLITKDVCFKTFLPEELLSEEEHGTTEHITVTTIAFLTKDEIGIMARVRQSQRLAQKFWRFLTEWLIVHDSKGLEINEALCACGEVHRYFPAEWLVPLVRNRWLPLGERRAGHATAKSLAGLFRGSGWETSSLRENHEIAKLLQAINVRASELMFEIVAADDAEARATLENSVTDMLVTAGGNVSYLDHAREYIEDLKEDETLPEILAEHRKGRRIGQKNQRLGQQVENLVRKSLEDEGFTVERTGTGSDFKISAETGDLANLQLTLAGRNWLVEVKSTRDQDVRMTVTQARTAMAKGEGFLLCIVPVEPETTEPKLDEVRASMRFVQNIGSRFVKLCRNLDAIENLRDEAIAKSDTDVRLEIESGTARIRVANSLWRTGFLIADLSQQLK